MMSDIQEPGGFAWKRYAPVAAIAVAAGIGFYFRDFSTFQTLADNREALIAWRDGNFLLASLAFVAVYVAIVAFSLPGAAIASLTGGFLFGLAFGTTFNVLAATIGATAIFSAVRLGFGEALAARMEASDGAVKKIKEGLAANEVSYLLMMRLVPAVPFFVANLVPALVGVKTRNFVLTTLFGIIPGAIVFTWVGSGLGEVFARGETPDLSIIWDPQILLPMLALAALSAVPILVKKFKAKG